MGCCWSCEDDYDPYVRRGAVPVQRPRPHTTSTFRSPNDYSSRRVNDPYIWDSYTSPSIQIHRPQPRSIKVNNAIRRDRILPTQRQLPTPPVQKTRTAIIKPSQFEKAKPEPLYGEFKCVCGHFWRSLLTWRDGKQTCKRCKKEVRPQNQREVLPSDYSRDKDDVGEHPKELCQKCRELGRYCGRFNK